MGLSRDSRWEAVETGTEVWVRSLTPWPLRQASLAPGQAQNATGEEVVLYALRQPPRDGCLAHPWISTSKSKIALHLALSGLSMSSHAQHIGAHFSAPQFPQTLTL